nr:hypothetical protein [Tanacetum cinerariifolium]
FDELPQMASVQNSSDPAPTRPSMASAHNSFDPAPTCQNIASVQISSDPAPECQTMASAHNSFDPAPTCQNIASVQISSDPAPECQTMALEHGSLSPGRKGQENVSHGDKTDTTSNELDLLFSPMFDELLNGSSKVVSKSSVVSAADAPNQQQVIRNPSQSVRTRRQLESNAEMSMFVLTTLALEHSSLSPGRNCLENVSHRDKTDTTSNELDLLFSPMFDELLNGSTKVMSKSSAVSAADAPNQRVIPKTSVSRPQLKSNPQGGRVLRSNSRGKKLEVEEHRRNVKLLKNKMSVTACNDSLNVKTVNVKSVSAMCAKCLMIKKHDLCVPKSVAKPLRKTVASESIKKPRNNVRKLHERFGKTYKWTYIKFTPSGYMWKPKSTKENVNPNVSMPLANASRTANLIEIVLFIVDSGCSKHMTGNLKLLINFVEKFLGTVKFRNDQIAPILVYGDLVQGAVTIKRVYYVEGLNHNLFSVGQFCDADLEVAFRKSTCFIRDLKGNDLLT